MRKWGFFLVCFLVSVSGCATRPIEPDELQIYEENNDPLEPLNRTVFGFNTAVDTFVLEPAISAYRFVVPSSVRQGINNFFDNLKQPLYLANALMQGDGTAAGQITERFAANTLLGFWGVFDTASRMDIPVIKRGFGDTLAVWGIEKGGPYLILPLLGPSNPRDTVGLGVDALMTPIDWTLRKEPGLVYTRMGLEAFRTRDRAQDLMETIRKSSTDYYATMRSMYQQNRKKEINSLLGKETHVEVSSYDFDFPDDEEE